MRRWIAVFTAALLAMGTVLFPARADRVAGGADGDVMDGAPGIPDGAGSGSDIKVAVDQVASRYAVDVTFPDMNIIFGELVWNVNTSRYEIPGGAPAQNVFDIEVANHSDRPISVYGAASVSDVAEGIHISCDRTSENRYRIAAVKSGDQAPQTGVLRVSVSPAAGMSWERVVENIMDRSLSVGGVTYRIGTVAVSVEKAS